MDVPTCRVVLKQPSCHQPLLRRWCATVEHESRVLPVTREFHQRLAKKIRCFTIAAARVMRGVSLGVLDGAETAASMLPATSRGWPTRIGRRIVDRRPPIHPGVRHDPTQAGAHARAHAFRDRGAQAAVRAAGGTITDTGEFIPGEPYVFFRDPDGYEVEIWYEIPTAVRGTPCGKRCPGRGRNTPL